jgi:hypothetical protein
LIDLAAIKTVENGQRAGRTQLEHHTTTVIVEAAIEIASACYAEKVARRVPNDTAGPETVLWILEGMKDLEGPPLR